MKTKTIKLTLYTPEVIKIINDLPRGSRSLVVESALIAHMQTDSGRALLSHLRHRSSKGKTQKQRISNRDDTTDVFKKLKGDFN